MKPGDLVGKKRILLSENASQKLGHIAFVFPWAATTRIAVLVVVTSAGGGFRRFARRGRKWRRRSRVSSRWPVGGGRRDRAGEAGGAWRAVALCRDLRN